MKRNKTLSAIPAAVMFLAVISAVWGTGAIAAPGDIAASRDIACIIKTSNGISKNADMPFTDVSEDDWYYNDVSMAYRYGLINGKTQTTFASADNLTYAEAVKLAACMHQLSTTGAVTLTNASPVWYQSYVDYAKENNIISKDYSWSVQATRAGYMEIFANALSDDTLYLVNDIPDGSIPDVPMSHPQASAIYKLYRAGILQGIDTAHNCDPSSNIRRREVAAILTRMVFADMRIKFSIAGGAITSRAARAAVQNWVDSHPFQLGSILELESDGYTLDGITYYRFYLGIIRLGVAEILVNEKTGDMFHLTSPYSTVGFAPIDDWYSTDHADAADADLVSAERARASYERWLSDHSEMSEYALSQEPYGIYAADWVYYYQFQAENEEFYWFNILVNIDTGELSVMMISDGEDPVIEIVLLYDWYTEHYAVG